MYKCMECGHKLTEDDDPHDGCPECGGNDIDIDDVGEYNPRIKSKHRIGCDCRVCNEIVGRGLSGVGESYPEYNPRRRSGREETHRRRLSEQLGINLTWPQYYMYTRRGGFTSGDIRFGQRNPVPASFQFLPPEETPRRRGGAKKYLLGAEEKAWVRQQLALSVAKYNKEYLPMTISDVFGLFGEKPDPEPYNRPPWQMKVAMRDQLPGYHLVQPDSRRQIFVIERDPRYGESPAEIPEVSGPPTPAEEYNPYRRRRHMEENPHMGGNNRLWHPQKGSQEAREWMKALRDVRAGRITRQQMLDIRRRMMGRNN